MNNNDPKILVIDDERGLREGCRRILESEKFSVDLASDGKEALNLIQKNPYNLALVDLMMPVMGGLELMGEVKKLDLDLIMVVITGFATIETAVEAMKHGAYDYIPKPFSPDQLLAVVNRGLERQRLQRQAQQLIEERDRRLLEVTNEKSKIHAIVNSMADGVIVINRDHQLVLWNPAAIRMLNLTDRLESGKDINAIIAQHELIQIINKAVEPESTRFTMISEEIELKEPDQRTLMANVSVVRDENAELLGVVSILRDITQLKEIDRLKSQFVNMVAHELRAPLSAIEGFLSAYLTGAAGKDPKFNMQMLNRAKQRAHSLLDLVNDLLQISRMESQKAVRKKEWLDITHSINNSIELFRNQAEEKNITIEKILPESCPLIEADQSEMEQLFTNLVSNAIKYNVEQGSLTIKLEPIDNCLVIEVADTGIGIEEEDLSEVFEDFYRISRPETRYITGTGLGLSIVKKIVESNHGRIHIKSKVNEGTTVVVKFPIKENKPCA